MASTAAIATPESPAKKLKPFRRIAAQDLPNIDLRKEIDNYGYVLVTGVIPPDPLNGLLHDITAILNRAGWLAPGTDPGERIANQLAACADGEPAHKAVDSQVFNLFSFHALPHHSVLQDLMKRIVGPQLLVLPKSAPRLIFPNFERGVIHAHQDHTAIAGPTDCFTAWMPLHPCPIELGPLRVLEGSHRFGMLPKAGKTGYIAHETFPPGDWVTGQIDPGDVLIFNSLTVHEAAPNLSNQFRISIDCRFQSYRDPVYPGTLVFTSAGSRTWEDVYADWPSAALQYYWTKFPLTFRPSPPELEELARTAETEFFRGYYLRIFERIEAQRIAHPWPQAEKH